MRSAYSGPIPEATELIKYNQACPDAAERIIAMAEREAIHRHEMQKMEQKDRRSIVICSMVCAVMVVALMAGVLIFAIYQGQASTALAAAITAVAGLAGVFFWFKRK